MENFIFCAVFDFSSDLDLFRYVWPFSGHLALKG